VRQGLASDDDYANMDEDNDGNNNEHRIRPSTNSNFELIEDVPLNQIFQKAVVLQRMGDRTGCLAEYERFITMAQSHDVHPSLYAEVYANIGAIYAMQASASSSSTDVVNTRKKELREKAKYSFQESIKYRPSLCSTYVNLSLLLLSEGKELGNTPSEQIQVKELLREARQCCERALGLDNDVDERSRSLAYKLIGDIDKLMKQQR
jgi:tetratricopeptide (TPR) repeat protein